MNLAILTWYNRGENVGQVIQAFALQEAIKGEVKGCDVTILNYQYKYNKIVLNYCVFPLYKIYRALKYGGFKRYLLFEKFRKERLNTSIALFKEHQIEEYLRENNINTIILGSDQLWNFELGRVPDGMLLNFNCNSLTRISYSPSSCHSGRYAKYKDELSRIVESVNQYEFAGVRDANLKSYLSLNTNKEIYLMLDPVFLLDADRYKRIEEKGHSKTINENKPFLFVYLVGDTISDSLCNAVRWAQQKYKADTVLSIFVNGVNEIPKEWIVIKEYNPANVLWMEDKAKFVFCDSFHMAAFSIIYRKQFYVAIPQKKDFPPNPERILELLENFKMSKRILTKDNKTFEEINYNTDAIAVIDNKTEENYKIFKKMCRCIK